MLAVISDIHFQDTLNDAILNDENKMINSDRNVSIDAFKETFDKIISLAKDNKANELLILLAGDIFDMHRSQKWCETEVRPYGKYTVAQWGPIAENILEDIINCNINTFTTITKILRNPPKNLRTIELIYFPGNHDRIINLHPPLRKRVRELLGQPSTANPPFEHYYSSDDYGVLIFHGHEYDSFNFAGKVPAEGIRKIDTASYGLPTLGDFVTIDITTAFAYEYRKRYGKELKSDKTHQAIYCKLLEYDDVRPQSKVMDFLQADFPCGTESWKLIWPVVHTTFKKALGNKFLYSNVGVWGNVLAFLRIIPMQVIAKIIIKLLCSIHTNNKLPCEYALDEQYLSESSGRYVVAGHTHSPTVEFLRKRNDKKEVFFFDTGTWRQQIRRCVDNKTFSRAKALTYVIFYKKDEDPSRKNELKDYSFDYWSGFTKKEIVSVPSFQNRVNLSNLASRQAIARGHGIEPFNCT